MSAQRFPLSLLASAAALIAAPSLAQSASPNKLAPAGVKLVYSPADFARFSPKTAYDML